MDLFKGFYLMHIAMLGMAAFFFDDLTTLHTIIGYFTSSLFMMAYVNFKE